MDMLGRIRTKQGMLLGRMLSLGFDFQDETLLTTLSVELTSSSEIEGENLDLAQVRSSIARRLGIESVGMVGASRYVEGVVEMLLDATIELSEIILALADDLSTGRTLTSDLLRHQRTPESKQWFERYVLMKPAGIGAK